MREKILEFMQAHGPVLPVDIARLINTNIMLASAHLSELASKGMVRISHLKVGGSPLYYLPGQESRLQDYSSRLHEKEQKAFELLKQKGVLKDSEQPPVVRYALRQIKDFAKPFEVTLKGEKHLFWRWYLKPMGEVGAVIRHNYLSQSAKPVPQNQQQHPLSPQAQPNQGVSAPALRAAPRSGPFLTQMRSFFEHNKITCLREEVLRRGRHAWYIVKIPTSIGPMSYYVEAKSKARLTEADLSEALVRGGNKRLPVLFITNGKLTKKTETLLATEFKGITVKRLPKPF